MDPEEIKRHLRGAILRDAVGKEIGKIHSVGITESGRKLSFKISDYGAGLKYKWTLDTEHVINKLGYTSAVDKIREVADLYQSDKGDRFILRGRGLGRRGRAMDSGSPGPGDPELDL